MPAKGQKKGYIKNPETGQWIDPDNTMSLQSGTTIISSDTSKVIVVPATSDNSKVDKRVDKLVTKKTKENVKDDLGPTTRSTKEDDDYAKIIISWKDQRGRLRTTQYVMAELTINESTNEEFNGAKKQIRIHVSIDGSVLEKI